MRDQRGFTLVELLLAMTMSLVAAGAGLSLLGIAGQRNVENQRYADRVRDAQISLERMTRELRQANWLQFSSSMVVDVDVPVRASATGTSTNRHVRYDCSQGSTCVRYEGAPTTFPVPSGAGFSTSAVALESLRPGSAVFTPQRIDPDSGDPVADYNAPTTLAVEIAIEVPGWDRAIRLDDSVTLRNATRFASG